MPLFSKKIITITGVRRCGKTWYLYQLIAELLQKTSIENIVYINFEDERLDMGVGDLQSLLDAYFELYPDNENELFFFFDEIQNVQGWEKFVRRVHDTVSKHIFITGSSSKLLSREIATSLRGRAVSFELFPFSFKEYLTAHAIGTEDIYSTKNKAKINARFEHYLFEGGFPEVALYSPEMRKKTLQSYFDVMLYRDLLERYNIKNIVALKYFIKKGIANTSNKISLNKLFNELKSMGIKLSKETLYKFADYVQECYLFSLVNMISESVGKQIANDKKLYVIDNGLVNAISFKLSKDEGKLLENLVYNHLKKKGNEIYYFQEKNECDFVETEKNKVVTAVQVTLEMSGVNKKREVNGLLQALEKYDLPEGYIITKDQNYDLETGGKKIFVRPAWEWLLTERRA